MAPSATWTTCPYVVRDGHVNPDVRTLNGPEAINSASQVVFYNAIAYHLRTSSEYSKNWVRFIDAFFLDPTTGMKPNLNFGQIVRGPGPGGSLGTFTGILDLRGIVKVINSVLIMEAATSPDWTRTKNEAMRSWMTQYTTWLTQSDIGIHTASRPNNHASFYVSQVAATKMFIGNDSEAAATLQEYFTTQFLDQIARSGEQPFEAVRTRPFHYRCFNLEAMIINAKLGDQLGLNFWTAKSKYGATIQMATDYLMRLNPKNEDILELVPHVAAIAAAYGDPTGKYAAFLEKAIPKYQARPFWFYDQTVALPNSPAATMDKHSERELAADSVFPFECPAVFEDVGIVEIDDGIWVTCEDLKPYYDIQI